MTGTVLRDIVRSTINFLRVRAVTYTYLEVSRQRMNPLGRFADIAPSSTRRRTQHTAQVLIKKQFRTFSFFKQPKHNSRYNNNGLTSSSCCLLKLLSSPWKRKPTMAAAPLLQMGWTCFLPPPNNANTPRRQAAVPCPTAEAPLVPSPLTSTYLNHLQRRYSFLRYSWTC